MNFGTWRSHNEECLDQLILFGEGRLIGAVDEFVATTTGSGTIRGSAIDALR